MKVKLPDSIALNLKPAGFGSRFLAYFIDCTIRWIFIGTIVLVLLTALGKLPSINIEEYKGGNPLSTAATSFIILFIFLIEWSYAVFFEISRGGRTPGKKLLGLRVVSTEGLEVDLKTSALRNVLTIVDMMPAFGLVALIATMSNGQRQRLGDLAAGTLVVHDEEELAPELRDNLREDLVEIDQDLHNSLGKYLKRKDFLFKEQKNNIALKFSSELEKTAKQLNLTPSTFRSLDDYFQEIFNQTRPQKTNRD